MNVAYLNLSVLSLSLSLSFFLSLFLSLSLSDADTSFNLSDSNTLSTSSSLEQLRASRRNYQIRFSNQTKGAFLRQMIMRHQNSFRFRNQLFAKLNNRDGPRDNSFITKIILKCERSQRCKLTATSKFNLQ